MSEARTSGQSESGPYQDMILGSPQLFDYSWGSVGEPERRFGWSAQHVKVGATSGQRRIFRWSQLVDVEVVDESTALLETPNESLRVDLPPRVSAMILAHWKRASGLTSF